MFEVRLTESCFTTVVTTPRYVELKRQEQRRHRDEAKPVHRSFVLLMTAYADKDSVCRYQNCDVDWWCVVSGR
jgi:hypothetical protein